MGPIRDQLRAFYDTEMHARAERPLGPDREQHLAGFIDECGRRALRRVLEVGCGAGRDGTAIREAGLDYHGVDLSPVAVEICRRLGLDAVEGLATDLPFEDASFDAAWTMSTLMHLELDEMIDALTELRRVVRPGGMVEIGVWGHTTDGVRMADDGRYFRHCTDEGLQVLLAEIGDLETFGTWDWFEEGGHYQWARVTVRPTEPTVVT
jgi:SAM-dependent methyltransferase